ncbi:MAG: filamentous hemagglutinin N-terminal domain-containing protein [Microcoleaceae cyanobacterium]
MTRNCLFSLFSSTIFLSPALLILANLTPSQAQIVPDNTLGSERSVVNPVNSGRDQIEGGASRGSNLFHSFQEFNVGENRSVYFINPNGIQNILSRVTGRNPSNIFGQLGVLGNANLFLINPNGIIFGPNSSLDIRGSFLATTADEIRLGEDGFFSALQPNQNPLLTVNPSALFFNQLQALNRGSIVNQSVANGVGLQIASGQTLGLVGRTVVLDGGILTASQGRIELGSADAESLVGLNLTETGYVLDFSRVANPLDIRLRNGALINVSGPGSGSLQAVGRLIALTEGSVISGNTLGNGAGGDLTVTAERLVLASGSSIVTRLLGSDQGSSLTVNADQVELTGAFVSPLFAGGLSTSVELGATGQGGNLTVNTRRLSLSNGAQIESVNAGDGIGGALRVQADEIVAIGALQDSSSGIRTDVFPEATGQAGNLTLNTRTLSLRDGAQVGSAVFGNAKGGNMIVNASESIEAIGTTPGESLFPQVNQTLALFNGQFPAGLLTTVFSGGIGQGGDLTVNTPRLTLQNGGLVAAGTINAPGNSGQLHVRADEINVIGTSSDGFFPTSILTSVLAGATGQGGNLGIETRTLNLRDGGQVRAGTSGVGNSGNVTVQAHEIHLDGISNNGRFPSSILAEVENLSDVIPGSLGRGNGGNILIDTHQLTLQNGGQIRAGTFGPGKGGNIEVNAVDVKAMGLSLDGSTISGLFSDVGSGSSGDGGNLTITTERLTLQDGAQLGANVFSSGQGGTLTVNAPEIQVMGSGAGQSSDPQQSLILQFLGGRFPSGILALVEPGATGSAGALTVNTQRLTLTEGGVIGTGTFGSGNSGNLTANASEFIEARGTSVAGFPPSSLFTSVLPSATGQGGDLIVDTPRLTLIDGGQVRAGTSGFGNSGNITVTAGEVHATGFSGLFASGITAEVEDLSVLVEGAVGRGQGGNIFLNSDTITLQNGAAISAATRGSGDSGNISIKSDTVTLQNEAVLTTNTAGTNLPQDGNGGNIEIETNQLLLENRARVAAETFGRGQAGTILVNANDIQLLDSTLSSAAGLGSSGNAGNIEINTQNLTLENGGLVVASTFSSGRGGNVEVNARDRITAIGISPASDTTASGINVQAIASGNAGDILINTPQLILRDGGGIRSNVLGSGNGGQITVNADEIQASGTIPFASTDPVFSLLQDASNAQVPSGILTTVLPGGSGQGGEIEVNAQRITLEDGAGIGTGTFGLGNSGNLTVNADSVQARGVSRAGFPPSSLFTSVFLEGATGAGGDLTLNAQRLVLRDGAQVRAGTSGPGDSGNLRVVVDVIDMAGVSPNPDIPLQSGIVAEVEDLSFLTPGAIGTGNAGDLFIQTRDMTLQTGAVTTASTAGSGQAGNLTILADNLVIDSKAVLTASTLASGSAGNLVLGVKNLIVRGGSLATVNTDGKGQAGNLFIDALNIQLLDGGVIAASTTSAGRGGEINIRADSLTARGISPDGMTPSGIVTQSFGAGAGGSIAITTTQRLSLQGGALIQASVFGSGQGGTINLSANQIEAVGTGAVNNSTPQFQAFFQALGYQSTSGILTTVVGGTGQGGDLSIDAQRITLADGAQIGAGTFGGGNSGNLTIRSPEIEITGAFGNEFLPSSFFTSVFLDEGGNGGDMTIEAQNLILRDGGQVRAGTSGPGSSGDLTLRVDNIELTGRSANGQLPSGIVAAVQDLSAVNLGRGTGDGGNISIQSDRITVQEDAEITASSSATGAAGSLIVQSNVLSMNNNGVLSAETASGEGNITLNVPLIELQDSRMTTNATGTATGGNITLNTDLLIARNSQISANAVESSGGNIQIQSEGVFLDRDSAITATSEFGFDGTVEIDTTVDPAQGILQLPTNVLDAASIIAQDLCAPEEGRVAKGSSFIVTGRGGLPPSPTEPLTVLQGLIEWESGSREQKTAQELPSRTNDPAVIVRQREHSPVVQQAQGWEITPTGQVVLTAHPTHATPQGAGLGHPSCPPAVVPQ